MEQNPALAPIAYLTRASAYAKKNELQAAIDDLSKAIDLDPSKPDGFQLRAGIKGRLKLHAEALEDIQKAVELRPSDPIIRLNYSYTLSRTGDYAAAQRELEEAERMGAKSAWFYNNLAWLLSTADDDTVRNGGKAEKAIKAAIELMPNEPSLWDTQAAVCAELGLFEEAIKWQKRYLRSKVLTPEQQKNGQQRLELYEKRESYRQPVGG